MLLSCWKTEILFSLFFNVCLKRIITHDIWKLLKLSPETTSKYFISDQYLQDVISLKLARFYWRKSYINMLVIRLQFIYGFIKMGQTIINLFTTTQDVAQLTDNRTFADVYKQTSSPHLINWITIFSSVNFLSNIWFSNSSSSIIFNFQSKLNARFQSEDVII